MTDQRTIVGLLNELLAAERAGLAPRLLESTVFVSRLSIEALEAVQSMAGEGEEHAAWLADAVIQLGGVPGLRFPDSRTGDLHYLELGHVLPRLVAAEEEVIRKYTLAAGRINEEPRVAELISDILGRHRKKLASVRKFCSRETGVTGS